MRRSKAEVDRYISSVHSSSPSLKEKPIKGFLFAKLYFEAKEYELAKRHVSEYLKIQERDPKAHKFLGQLFEKEGEVDKAVGCYKRSVDLNPAQKDLVLKVAELLCSKDPTDSRADFWVEKANKLLPGNPAVFNLKEKLLSRQGQQGWNRLFDLLQSELAVRPADVHVNIKLVELYSKDGRLDEAVKHCLSHENKGQLRKSLDWNSVVADTLQEYLAQPGVSNNEKLCRRLKGELLLAHCNLLRLKLSVSGVLPALDALRSFDEAMRSVSATAGGQTDELCEVFGEMRAHLYLHTGTLLLKMAQEREQNWRAVTDLATLCFLLSYQVPRPKLKLTKGDQLAPKLLELMANDRQSQAGHMLLNLSSDPQTFITEVVEAFGNRIGQSSLFELLFGEQSSTSASFMANDDFASINTQVPEFSQLAKWDNGSIMLHGGDLQHLSWLGLQWTLLAQRPALREWLKQLFPRLNLETSKLDTNAPESISLLDLEVFVCGVVFCCHSQLQETAKISCVGQQPFSEPRCLPLPLLRSLSTDRQREWWDALYSLIHKQALTGTSAKLRMVVQHGLSSIRAGEKHGLQPALAISWAQHLSQMGMEVNSYYDQKEYIGRSVHYWKAALPLLDKIKNRRSIPEPLDPLFIHFSNRDIQISIVKGYEEEAMIGFASLLDVEGKTEEAISTLETINNVSSSWHLARAISDKTILPQLPISMEEVMDLLNEVNQQLEEIAPTRSTPETTATFSRINFPTTSPNKSTVSPSKIHLMSPKTPPHWVEDQKSLLQMLCQQVEALKVRFFYVAFLWYCNLSTLACSFGNATTGQSGYYNQSYNSQYPPRTSANVTPTKGSMYTMNRMPPQPHMYSYQQPNHTPPMQPALPCVYPPQEQVFGAPLRFESPATNLLSPYSEEHYSRGVTQPTTNLPLPEPGYFTKPSPVTVQPKSIEGKAMDFGKISFGQIALSDIPKVPSLVAGPTSQTAQSSDFKFNSNNFKSNDGDFTFSASPAKHSESLLGLLTSDISTKTDFEQKPGTQDQSTSQGSIFTFGTKNLSGFSFASATTNTGIPGAFEKVEKPFSFGDVNKPIDEVEKQPQVEQNQPLESDNDSTQLEDDDDGPHFEPIVPLPDKIDVKTGEEEEQELFCNRAKLYRFEMETKEWKERGIGNIKILKHNISGKVRILMRREQVLKICANHYINADTLLKPNAGSDKSWVWNAIDYADEQPKPEQLAIRFKTAEEAMLFKTKFDEAQQNVPKSPTKHCLQEKRDVGYKLNETKSSFGAQFALKDGEWDCNVCYVRNKPKDIQCVACQTKNPQTNSSSTPFSGFGAFGSSNPPFSFVTSGQTLADTGTSAFGAQFNKKQGQWDCDACYVRNESASNSCVACQAPHSSTASGVKKPSETAGPPPETAAAPTTESQSSAFGSSFGSQFGMKAGQWDCDACYVRNESSSTSCVACQTPQASAAAVVSGTFGPPAQMAAGPTSKPQSSAFGSSFGSQFGMKQGQWDCDACYVRNEFSSKSCVACQTPQASAASVVSQTAGPPAQMAAAPTSKPQSSAFGSSFGSQFGMKQGQWDCDACYVRNESSSTSCVACQTPQASAASVITEKAGPPTQMKAAPTTKPLSSAFGSNFAPCPTSSLGAMFAKKVGEWDCDTCLVRNNASVSQCLSCQTANPNQSTSGPGTSIGISSSTFSFSFGDKTASSQSAVTTLTSGFGSSNGSSFKFGVPHSEIPVTTASSFSFALPTQAGGFKFGAQETTNVVSAMKTGPVTASTVLKNLADQHKETMSTQSIDGTKEDENALFTGRHDAFSFAALATSSSGDFQFGQNDPSFKGFSRAGENLFSSNQGSPSKVGSSAAQEEEDMYKTEENDDIQFEPVVQLPEKVDLVTGEEEEQVLYSQRVKLFRFDTGLSQWKERGLGVLKFLKNASNGRLRVLMRREQVLKVCANHWITTTMNLKPLAGSDKAWMWLANDFSDGDARLEQLAAKFKTPELASEFKQKFEECQRLLLDIPLQTPHKLVDTGRTAHLIQKAEEMKTGLKDLKCFLTDGKTKLCDESAANLTPSSNVMGLTVKPHTEGTGPTLEWDNYDLRGEPLDDSADTSVYASPLASSPVRKNLFRFGESTSGFSFSFQPGISPSKSPAKLNQSGVSVGTDDEQDSTQDEDKDGQYFEPIVPLPDLVEISTGEENEQVVFNHRAKLYRYDKDLNQWKERGIGEIRILQNFDTRRVRLIMRRDQVLKICCNHWITTAMKLEMMKGSEKAWVWSALDFTDAKDGRVEQLAVRFKLQDVANSFKEVFEKAKNAKDSETPMTPVASRVATPQETMPAMTTPTQVCGKEAIAILEEAIKERTDLISDSQPLTAITCSPSNPMKMVVSPPKFVFGTDTLQKIFGPTKSSPEPEINSSNSRTEDNLNVSQSSASPAFKIPEKGKSSNAGLNILFQSIYQKAVSLSISKLLMGEPVPKKIPSSAEGSSENWVSDVEVVYIREPTPEQAALAESLLLPLTFFCYKNEPSYTSDDETDDEDYESAVNSLNGKLYPDPTARGATASDGLVFVFSPTGFTSDPDCQVVWEKKPTPEEEEKAKSLQLPPTFFCELGTSDSEGDKAEEFETEVRKVQEALVWEAISDQASEAQNTVPSNGCPIDLSTKKSKDSDLTVDARTPIFLSSLDTNFSWANAGASVFGGAAKPKKNGEEGEGDEGEAADEVDIHFEPIVSLPEVETKSGEEDEEILFKERTKLYRWDRGLNQWKERGVGDIKILYHPAKGTYRVIMRREQVLNVCANHIITPIMELKPMNSSANALVWTTTDYAGKTPLQCFDVILNIYTPFSIVSNVFAIY
uniref:RAN binding protein 2 n=1 Tax=Gadus morhua TaxID=8049 RepID=A0A8C5CV65_GADMO